MIELWTCHLLHWSWPHALLNAAAAVPPLVAMASGEWRPSPPLRGPSPRERGEGGRRPGEGRHSPLRRLWLFVPFLFAAAPCIALAVRAGFAGEYRGASGLVVAMWVFAGVLSRHRLLLAIVAAKLAAEALGLLPAHAGFVTVPIAHYAGAAAGLIGAWIQQKARPWPGDGRSALECADWVAACFSDQRRG